MDTFVSIATVLNDLGFQTSEERLATLVVGTAPLILGTAFVLGRVTGAVLERFSRKVVNPRLENAQFR